MEEKPKIVEIDLSFKKLKFIKPQEKLLPGLFLKVLSTVIDVPAGEPPHVYEIKDHLLHLSVAATTQELDLALFQSHKGYITSEETLMAANKLVLQADGTAHTIVSLYSPGTKKSLCHLYLTVTVKRPKPDTARPEKVKQIFS